MIIRVAKDTNPFAQISRACLEDRHLSWKARGLLAYLLCKPDGWEVHSRQLVQASEKDKRTAVQTGMAELLKFGYAKLETLRGEKGRIRGKQYVVAESPIFLTHRETGFPSLGKNRETEKPSDGKTVRRKTCSISNTESESKNNKRERLKEENLSVPAHKTPEIDSFHPDVVQPQLVEVFEEVKSPHRQSQKSSTSTQIAPEIPSEIDEPLPKVLPLRSAQPKTANTAHAWQQVLGHLILVSGRPFRTPGLIVSALTQGYLVEDLLLVIDWWAAVKTVEDPGQSKYFDNDTPFRPTKIDKYHAAAVVWDREGRPAVLRSGLLHPRSAQAVQAAVKDVHHDGGPRLPALFNGAQSPRRSLGGARH